MVLADVHVTDAGQVQPLRELDPCAKRDLCGTGTRVACRYSSIICSQTHGLAVERMPAVVSDRLVLLQATSVSLCHQMYM